MVDDSEPRVGTHTKDREDCTPAKLRKGGVTTPNRLDVLKVEAMVESEEEDATP